MTIFHLNINNKKVYHKIKLVNKKVLVIKIWIYVLLLNLKILYQKG